MRPLALVPLVVALAAPASSAAGPTPTATYRLVFDATWSAATHPGAYPANAHFSGIVGGTHAAAADFWEPGAPASPGIQDMAELGVKTTLLDEVGQAIDGGTAADTICIGAFLPSPGVYQGTFTIGLDHPLVTVTTMIAPSPDWFVGTDGLALLADGAWVDEVVVELFAWDAGTDSGTTFTAPNQPTIPPDPIAPLGPPLDNGVPLGTFTFTRIDTPPVFTDLGGALAGVAGEPSLAGSGTLVGGTPVALDLADAAPLAATSLVVGTGLLQAPFKGGTLVPAPDLVLGGLATDATGALTLASTWPAGLPAGTSVVFQGWITDAAAPKGLSASNGLCATTP